MDVIILERELKSVGGIVLRRVMQGMMAQQRG